jgi:hypothetical protein
MFDHVTKELMLFCGCGVEVQSLTAAVEKFSGLKVFAISSSHVMKFLVYCCDVHLLGDRN